ncbi:MAG: hypothetical protein Q9202_006493 [Teloschistes flavicans]
MACSGFLTFGDKTKGNVLNNFPTDNVVVNVARLSPSTGPLNHEYLQEMQKQIAAPTRPEWYDDE